MTLTKSLGGSGGGGGSGTFTTIKDEGTTLSTAVTSLDIVGPNLAATGTTAVTLTQTGVGKTPDDQPTSPNAADDEFDGSSLDTAGTRRTGATPWAWVNQGTATATVQYGSLGLYTPANSGDQIRLVLQAVPSGTWTFEGKFRGFRWLAVNYATFGLALRESATSKLELLSIGWNNNYGISHDRFTNNTTFSATPTRHTPNGTMEAVHYFRASRNGSNQLLFEYSYDRLTWFTLTSAWAQNTFFTTAPDQIGVFIDSNNASSAASGAVDWWRRTA